MIQFPDGADADPLERDFPVGDGVAETSTFVHCPWCAAEVEVLLDAGGGTRQEYVEDCEVCCRPWVVTVRWHGGTPSVALEREDG